MTASELNALVGDGQLRRLFFHHRSSEYRLTAPAHPRADGDQPAGARHAARTAARSGDAPGQPAVGVDRQAAATQRLTGRRTSGADANWRWIAWLVLGIGGLIAAAGVAIGVGNLRHVLYGERADGVVTEIVRDGDMYAPVVRFRLPQGESIEVRDLASGAPDFAVGDASPSSTGPRRPRTFASRRSTGSGSCRCCSQASAASG